MLDKDSVAKNASIEFGYPLDLTWGELIQFYPPDVIRSWIFPPPAVAISDGSAVLDAVERAAEEGRAP